GRWKWFERTFPSFVGPEDKVSIPIAEPAGKGRASQMGPGREAVQPVAKTAPPTKAPEYPNQNTRIQLWKKCPRCAEKCYLEDTRCRHCDHQFDADELARLIARIFDEHHDQFSRYVDFNSETKQCPACAESIKLEALICRHCRREFASAEVQISKMRVFRQKAMGISRQSESEIGGRQKGTYNKDILPGILDRIKEDPGDAGAIKDRGDERSSLDAGWRLDEASRDLVHKWSEYRRKKSPGTKSTLILVGTIVCAGFLFFVLVNLNSKNSKQVEFDAVKKELAQTARELAEKNLADTIAASKSAQPVQPKAADPLPVDSGRTAPASRPALSPSEALRGLNGLLKEVHARTLKEQASIATDVANLNLETVLLPQTLSTNAGIEENRRIIRQYTLLLDKSMKISRDAISEMDRGVAALMDGQPRETEFMVGYAKGKKRRADLEAKMYANQKAIIATLSKINEFMSQRLGRVTVRDDQLLFQSQEEVDTYNSLIEQIERQAQLEAQLQQLYKDMLQKNVSDLEKFTK
ncbi:MAG: hypothetical protein L0338_26155, partial [Acidobacteria bacterium]|nr:hypothetical protein [Acidobacteriota bacterium]